MRTTAMVCVAVVVVATGWAQGVATMQCDNPIAGFSLTMPEDWAMAAGPGGNIEIAIDAVVGSSMALQPALWYFSSPQPPDKEAQALKRALTLLGNGAQPTCAPTGNKGEWELQMTSNGTRGPLRERWLCRSERGHSYVVAAMGRPEVYQQFAADVTTALKTFHLIPTVSMYFLREPTENAYRMTIPSGWKWEGQVFRSEMVPGYFVWKVEHPQGLAGAFSGPPATFNIMTPYCPAGQAAGALLLPYLRKETPDMQLEDVHELPRVGQTFMAAIRGAGLGNNPRVDRVRADYVGTRKGTRVRLRLDIVTWMLDQSVVLGGRGNWILTASGAWGPVDQFDKYYAIGRGVIASLKTDPRWRAAQMNTVNDVLNNRNKVMDRIGMDWNSWIRDNEPVPDPQTGERKEVPIGDGDPWFDKDGKAHRVPPDQEQAARDKGWDRVRR